eukprot:TRINITY_DN13204_c0_g2_i1.p1 TRINITY_DN13204_c0_g2~~TRINITY_DN13204_c0_g2_i1.p1  ORF type:complete len:334 (-),score=39.44 TRINITY_DN13204_c0_g2_i1:168-1049(-)
MASYEFAASEDSSIIGSASFGARSDGAWSQADSHIGAPRWERLLKGAAASLTRRIGKVHEAELSSEWQLFFVQDAIGGGTEVDVYHCLKSLLDVLSLNEVDTGVVLIGAHHFLSAVDLPLCCQTWRPLTFTSLLASLRIAITGVQRKKSSDELLSRVAHWWPRDKAEDACAFFANRQAFKDNRLTPSKHAEYYFTLRATGLQMGGWDACSNASAVNSVEINDVNLPSGGQEPVPSKNKRLANSGGKLSESSFTYSDDGFSDYHQSQSYETFAGSCSRADEAVAPPKRNTQLSL